MRVGAALASSAHEHEWVGLWHQGLISVAKAWAKPYARKRLPKQLPTNNEPLAERSRRQMRPRWREVRKRLRFKWLESSSSLTAMSKRLLNDLL